MQLELIHLCTILIQYAGKLFIEHRKELIQFGWCAVGRPDLTWGLPVGCQGGQSAQRGRPSPHRWTLKYDNAAKPFAFLCVAQFFRVFETPEKIMLQVCAEYVHCASPCAAVTGAKLAAAPWRAQVYVALARLAPADQAARLAIRQATDLLIETLAQTESQPLSATPASATPSYSRYLKKILLEEGHSSSTLHQVFQMIVRHRELFFQTRWDIPRLARSRPPHQCSTLIPPVARALQGPVCPSHAQHSHPLGLAW